MNRTRTLLNNENLTYATPGAYVNTQEIVANELNHEDEADEMVNEMQAPYGDGVPEVDAADINQIKNISIKQLNYGYIVTVGCHNFAIESHDRVTTLLNEYMANPQKVESTWYKNEFTLKRNPSV